MIQNLILIQLICVLLIDVTGAVEDFLTPLVKKLTGAKIGTLGKPWSCSLCQTHWLGLLYLLITGTFSIANYAYVLLLACLTPVTLMLYHLVIDILTKMVETLYNYFNL